MKILSPRFLVVAGLGCAALVALPPAYAMDIMERIVSTQTTMIRHEATEYQRKVAEANARAYMAAQLRAYRRSVDAKEEAPTPKPAKPGKTGKTGKTAKVDTATPKPYPQHVSEEQDRKEMKKKLPRYIAVDTPKDKRSAPGTKKDVMIWDTQSESLVGNNVYDVQNPPAVGTNTKFETYSAQYVGNGL